ncbi:Permease of the drug/metabolite transporter (DMT) superfamily [Cohaesibacter sp. ES.047]|uniref:DMT family transporter n=1 Tax=Cohaesibacter sp. ES.047 TaxID=1798205 RepID=UPI000BB9918B|nr:DMT family transporter [Cohaesibacter sp. ES.047]SNY94314.1 Permease of the drug/metabolite transporter (DMT) superfamily [Cohaesibacter sp. ES.047]
MKQVRDAIANKVETFLALPKHLQGILVAILAMVGFSTMGAMFKHLGQDLHPAQIIALRQPMMVLIFIPALIKTKPEDRKINRFDLFMVRAVLMFFSMLANITAIIHLPLATSTTLSFTRTFFITVFAIFILKEVVGPRRLGALLVGFLGVLVVARPVELLTVGPAGFDFNIVLSLVAAACLALNQIIVRIQSRNNRPTVIVVGQAVLVGLAMIPLAYMHWKDPTAEQWVLIALVAVVASISQWLMVTSFKLTPATVLAPFDYLRLIFATALGWYIFGEWPDHYTWIGAAIIFASTFYIMRREAKLKKKPVRPSEI